MSDTALGPQWWRAADGKWHPPELRPPSARAAADAVANPAAGEAVPGSGSPTGDDSPDASGEAMDLAHGDAATPSVTDIAGGLGAVPDGPTPTEVSRGGPDDTRAEPSLTVVPESEPAAPTPTFASSMPIRPVEPTYAWGPVVPDSELPSELQRTLPPFQPRTAPAAPPERTAPVDPPAPTVDPPIPTMDASDTADTPATPTADATGVDAYSGDYSRARADTTVDADLAATVVDGGDDEMAASLHSLVFAEPVQADIAPDSEGTPAPLQAIDGPEAIGIDTEPGISAAAPVSHSRVTEPIPAEFATAAATPAPPAAVVTAPAPSPESVAATALLAPGAMRPETPAHDRAETRPVEEVLAGPTVSGSAPRTTNIPASIAAKNAEHFKGSREFPDLLGMALKGSSLADQVEVKYDATSSRNAPTGNAADKEQPTGGSEKNGKRWKRKGR